MFFLPRAPSATSKALWVREVGCAMHWVAVGTSGTRWDTRLCVAQYLEVPRVAYSTSKGCQYHQKSSKIIKIHWKFNGNQWKSNGNQWKSSKPNENAWLSLILYDSACSSNRLASVQGLCHRRLMHKRLSQRATVVLLPTQCVTKPISGPMAPPRSLTDPVAKKT